MNRTEEILLRTIQKALWNTDVSFPADTDWQAVLSEAEAQAVLGIVIGTAPNDIRRQWAGKAGRITADFVRILHYQTELCELMKANGIPMVILKGMAAAVYYPNPSQRSMGDIDFLVLQDHFARAREILEQNGYEFRDDPRIPRHVHIQKDTVSFEMHRFFSSDGIDIEPVILEGLRTVESGTVVGTGFPMLPGLANGMVLLAHLVQHLKTGLGLRQVLDWMLYAEKELDDVFWEQTFRTEAEKAGLKTIAVAATRMCQLFLGLSNKLTWCLEADPDVCGELMENLLASGNFGKKRGVGSSVELVTAKIQRRGLFRNLQRSGEFNWQAYRKHKCLKPFAWIYQIGRYLRQGLSAKRNSKQFREDIQRGNRRAELLRKLGIG